MNIIVGKSCARTLRFAHILTMFVASCVAGYGTAWSLDVQQVNRAAEGEAVAGSPADAQAGIAQAIE